MENKTLLKYIFMAGITNAVVTSPFFYKAEPTMKGIKKIRDWEKIFEEYEKFKEDLRKHVEKSVVEISGTKSEEVEISNPFSSMNFFLNSFTVFDDDEADKDGEENNESLKGIKNKKLTTNGFLIQEGILTSYSDIAGYENLTVKIDGKNYDVIRINYDKISNVALLTIDASELNCLSIGKSEEYNDSKKFLYKISGNVNCSETVSTEIDNDSQEEEEGPKKKSKKGGKCCNGRKGKEKKEVKEEENKNINQYNFTNKFSSSLGRNSVFVNNYGEIVGFFAKDGKFLGKTFNKYSSIIPGTEIAKIVKFLKEDKKVEYDFGGLLLTSNDESSAIKYGCSIKDVNGELKSYDFSIDDIIVGLNGFSIDNVMTFERVFNRYKNYSDLVFTIKRVTTTVKKGKKNKNTYEENEVEVEIKVPFGIMSDVKFCLKDEVLDIPNFTLKNLNDEQKEILKKHNIDGGVIISSIKNSETSIRENFVITKYQNTELKDVDQLYNFVKRTIQGINKENSKEVVFYVEGYYLDNLSNKVFNRIQLL